MKEKKVKTNSALQRDVLDELGWSVDADEIGVSVENGVVVLNGTVKSLSEKGTAERVVQRMEGVRAVTDELVVKLPGDSQFSHASHRGRSTIDSLGVKATPSRCDSGHIRLNGSCLDC
jgi:hypothetical protein